MTIYCFQYKCRRCGHIENGVQGASHIILGFLYQLISYGKIVESTSCDGFAPGLRMFSVHNCSDGGFGITDLIGAREVIE